MLWDFMKPVVDFVAEPKGSKVQELIMIKRIDLFDSTYRHFTEQVLGAIRKETFGQPRTQKESRR